MPSTVFNDNIPYDVLFPNKQIFLVEPMEFRSTCYVRDVIPHVTKLDPKALKCVVWDILAYKRVIGATIQLLIDLWC